MSRFFVFNRWLLIVLSLRDSRYSMYSFTYKKQSFPRTKFKEMIMRSTIRKKGCVSAQIIQKLVCVSPAKSRNLKWSLVFKSFFPWSLTKKMTFQVNLICFMKDRLIRQKKSCLVVALYWIKWTPSDNFWNLKLESKIKCQLGLRMPQRLTTKFILNRY